MGEGRSGAESPVGAAAGAPIRVVLVDDQNLVRQGLRSLLALNPAIDVVGEASDGVDALAVIASQRPDVVLLDLQMPRLDGIGTLTALAERADHTPVLVLTTFDDGDAVLGALKAGAKGYLLKDVTLDALVEAISTIAAGGRVVQPAVTASLMDRITRGEEPPLAHAFGTSSVAEVTLTERETEVLRLMVAGYSNREIAASLYLAEGTVKNHVSNVLLKLGVRDRTRAVLRALELGLVTG